MMAMFPCAGFGYGLWWIFPFIMIGVMVLCFFMMRGRMGSMMCRRGGLPDCSMKMEEMKKQHRAPDEGADESERKKE
jgi:hypothetical protein